jgi:hypothetical protein
VQRVRLTKKLAPVLNGFDLSKFEVGDVIVVPDAIAAMLLREGWGQPVKNGEKITDSGGMKVRIVRQPEGTMEERSFSPERRRRPT